MLAEQQHDAVDDEERGGRNGFAQVDAEDVLQRQARDADGNRREDEQPRQTLVGRAHLAAHDAGDQTAHDAHPVPPEIDDQGERGGHVQADHERQIR